ncbi:tRNA dimethylallyltransferase [Levilactobacillus zymae]|uniref:tRNA dimethylallyltransferase n=1 Tax=Levilactobacillus zymae TaxID=267363 RepID=A0ABQ0WVC2_9LACO|nr:tRNA (adenosine(37)-N6)-dimethylallyltransferase MiaA [Levilactobacillus zymae]KRL07352.1 tRNA delta(2)-isopentenylpyrophosphate transferase [Levilactobacillus zymae DSM 19395]QFR60465.1 tRNA (adenosine(37)-N6)-dimethylallyltransferase MiaA [Levilactobacillus zymae]GEO71815.1 tRNA dimethylallyltransferase [Levilactobacillus zymae]
MEKVLAIVGPTAVGKTALAIELAQKFNGEIISGDSMQVYRHLDIGTAKATPTEQQQAPHHLIDVCDVTQQFTVAQFVAAARPLITAITARGHLPIIAGGTGFYLQALFDGLALGADAPGDPALRAQLRAEAEATGPQALWARLQQLDPVAAAKIPPTNVRRTVRALEVIQVTGQLFSHQQNGGPTYDERYLALTTDRQLLYRRINTRVDGMVQSGLLDEVRWLAQQGGADLPAASGIGYRELLPVLDQPERLPAAIARVKQDSRHYAKRQLTWFKHQTTAVWYDLVQHPDQRQAIDQWVAQWLTH